MKGDLFDADRTARKWRRKRERTGAVLLWTRIGALSFVAFLLGALPGYSSAGLEGAIAFGIGSFSLFWWKFAGGISKL